MSVKNVQRRLNSALRHGSRGAVVASLLFATAANADVFAVQHDCIEPLRPLAVETETQQRRFDGDVARYSACIEQFIEDQYDAIRRHRNAAEAAADELHLFRSYEAD